MEIIKSLKSMPAKQKNAGKYLAGFFALMILLTFLSRAADSFTVPVVTTERVTTGLLEHRVVVEGRLYPQSEIAVSAPAGYRILSLFVQPDMWVEAGAQIALLDTRHIQEQLEKAQAEIKQLQLLALAKAVGVPEREEEDAVDAAQRALERAREDLETAAGTGNTRISGGQGEVFAARRDVKKTRDLLCEGEATDQDLDNAQSALRRQEQALEEILLEQEKILQDAARAVEDAEIKLELEQKQLVQSKENTAADKQRQSLEQEAAHLEIQLAQKKANEQVALLNADGMITAPVSGVITKIQGETGSITSDASLLVLSDSSAGVRFHSYVSSDSLKYMQRGDSARIVLAGESKAIEDAVIESISTTAEQDGTYRVVAALPDGDWAPGISGKMTVLKQTSAYSQCVTNGAVRSDNSGNFVLVLRETNTVLGTQTIAERVNISVLERDERRCAIEGALDPNDRIITSSTQAITPGDRVRIQEDNQ